MKSVYSLRITFLSTQEGSSAAMFLQELRTDKQLQMNHYHNAPVNNSPCLTFKL